MSGSLIPSLQNGNPSDVTPVNSTPAITSIPKTIGLSVGYAGDIGWTVPTSQLVKIISSFDLTNADGINVVNAILDKPFSLSTSSEWKSLIGPANDAVNDVVQFFSGGTLSATSIYSSRRIWTSSEPLSLQLNLKFYAVNDAYQEVVSPVIRLQRLALPSYVVGNISMLTPPGPSPYSSSSTSTLSGGTTTNGDIINIFVGGFLYFNTVIVKQVSAEFGSQYDQSGYPLNATVQIEFQTYQVTTKSDISAMVYQNPLAQPQPLQSQTPTTAAGKGTIQSGGSTTFTP